ncbi:hypothetical protein SAMN04515618_105197 [Collimonas sp. OK307]|nr:hypothetical protein SAMN04515618_105197 [Collimonas sp. OK307]
MYPMYPDAEIKQRDINNLTGLSESSTQWDLMQQEMGRQPHG